jgi:hypothetical protein
MLHRLIMTSTGRKLEPLCKKRIYFIQQELSELPMYSFDKEMERREVLTDLP